MASPARDARLQAFSRGFTEVVKRGRGHLVKYTAGWEEGDSIPVWGKGIDIVNGVH